MQRSFGDATGVTRTRWPEPPRKQLEGYAAGSRRAEGGSPGEAARKNSEGGERRQEDPINVRDRAHDRRMPGKGGESSRVADEVGQRGCAGQRNPEGAGEDLWAQAAAMQGVSRTQRRQIPASGMIVWGRSKRGSRAGAWRGQLDPGSPAEGPVPNSPVAAA